jgi:hypothetical protein
MRRIFFYSRHGKTSSSKMKGTRFVKCGGRPDLCSTWACFSHRQVPRRGGAAKVLDELSSRNEDLYRFEEMLEGEGEASISS